MSIKNDTWIKSAAQKGMITPFHPHLVRRIDYDDIDSPTSKKVISYGLSSYGYDLRLSHLEFKVFRRPSPDFIVDPKKFDPRTLVPLPIQGDESGEFFILPAHTYGLGLTTERLEIPKNITAIFIGKSTYARCGIIANLTPGEANWRGHLTLEISNSSDADCRIYANEGIVQALFFEGEPCEVNYDTRNGKYQDQGESITLAKV